MQDDLTSKIAFRENLKNIMRLLAHVHKIDRSYYLLNTLRLLLGAVNGALSIVLSASLLQLLYDGASIRELVKPVLCLLLIPALLSLAGNILWNEFVWPKRENIGRTYDGDFHAKYREMDYSLMNSPYVKEITDRINRAHSWGSGIYDLFWKLDDIVSGFCNLVCFIAVAFPLFRIIARSRSLGMYLGLGGLVAVLCILTAAEAKTKAVYQEKLFGDRRKEYPEELWKKYASFSWYWVWECIDGAYHFIKDIHLYDGYDMMREYTVENTKKSEKEIPLAREAGKLGSRQGMLHGGTQRLMTLAGYLVSACYCMTGAFAIGDVVKFAGSLTNVLSGCQSILAQYRELALTARREKFIFELLEVKDEMYKGKLPVEKRLDNNYEIEFRNVFFRYPGQENYALKDFSLKLRVGKRMAVVGMNGSGKTTMIKLLCRLYDPQEGEILLNGVDIRKFKRDEYIQLFSVVFQDFGLLALPLGQNVAASLEVDAKRAEEALRQAGLGERLKGLPGGLDTWLYQNIRDDGVEISGGEAQKIAIARALYKDAPFVLLDEPTASLDPLSEYEIYSRFDSMVKDKTAIYISHRLSSCRFCDDIAVFHEGRLVQRGSHEELLKDEQGKYYELWNAQAQYYTEL